MKDAQPSRQPVGRVSITPLLTVSGLFGLFKAKGKVPAHAPQVTVEPTPAPPPIAHREPQMHPLRRDLPFKGLHEDVNPSASVKRAEMTCPACNRHFGFFVNPDGKPTLARCPGCTQQYRV